jgi:hypothetical protein
MAHDRSITRYSPHPHSRVLCGEKRAQSLVLRFWRRLRSRLRLFRLQSEFPFPSLTQNNNQNQQQEQHFC